MKRMGKGMGNKLISSSGRSRSVKSKSIGYSESEFAQIR